MSRQIGIAMDRQDEEAFLAFLRQAGEIDLYASHATSSDLRTSFDAEWGQFYIHNRSFNWTPVVESRQSSCNWLVTSCTPLIEYSRDPLQIDARIGGRLYWSKELSRHERDHYDLVAFDSWFSSIVRWVRRNGERARTGDNLTWCLPGAVRRLSRDL